MKVTVKIPILDSNLKHYKDAPYDQLPDKYLDKPTSYHATNTYIPDIQQPEDKEILPNDENGSNHERNLLGNGLDSSQVLNDDITITNKESKFLEGQEKDNSDHKNPKRHVDSVSNFICKGNVFCVCLYVERIFTSSALLYALRIQTKKPLGKL